MPLGTGGVIAMKIFLIILVCLSLTAPLVAFAQNNCPPGVTNRTCLPNPLARVLVGTPGQLIARVVSLFASAVALAAVIFLVFSGFRLMVAANEEAVVSAKNSILWSVGGFAVAVLAFTIVSGASRLLGFDPGVPGNAISPTGFLQVPGGDSQNFWSVATFVMNNILGLVGVVAVLMIIYYGYRYVVAAGNEESIAAAKTGLKWAILGFIVVLMAFTIISIVQRLLFFGA